MLNRPNCSKMRSPIFDEGIVSAGYENFHFKIRGWRADRNAQHFNQFLRNIANSPQLATAHLVRDGNGVALVSRDEFLNVREEDSLKTNNWPRSSSNENRGEILSS